MLRRGVGRVAIELLRTHLTDRHPDPALARSRGVVVAALGTAQTLAWASSYYLPATLADPIAAGVGVPRSWIFGAFSGALLIAAFAGPAVGRVIDRRGGRSVLVLSNVVLAAGLVVLAAATGVLGLFAAWAILGVGMALGLYDAGFAALTALYGHQARGPITGIALLAGFASTVSWPLSTFLDGALGWRETLLVWAALNIALGIPLNLLVPAATRPLPRPANARTNPSAGSPTRKCFFSPSCSPLSGSSPVRWRRICRAFSKSLAPRRCRRSPPPLWSDRRRSLRG